MNLATTVRLNNMVEIPQLGLGVFQTAASNETETAVAAALKAGYRHIDTAAMYGNEESVGRALKASGLDRNGVFITTKLANDAHDDPRAAFDDSLRKLDCDYIDLYLIHWPVPQRLASWKVLEEIYTEGRVRAIGVANFLVHHLEELLNTAEVTPAVNQFEIHPFMQQPQLYDYCREQGIAVEAYGPLTQGKKLDNATLTAIATAHDKSSVQVLIRWSLQRGFIAIPKSVHPERIRSNTEVYNFELSAAEMDRINALNENVRLYPDPDRFSK